MDKHLIVELSKEIQDRTETQMNLGKMERMQKFANQENKIDTNGILAFALGEAKLFTTLYTTDFLLTLNEYLEMDKEVAGGKSLEIPKEEAENKDKKENA